MALKITTEVASTAIAAVTALVDEGDEGSAQLIIWGGTAPASLADDIDAEATTLIATFELPDPAFGAPMQIDNEVEALAFEVAPVTADDVGEAQFFRIYNRDGVAVMQGAIGEGEESDAPLILNQKNITTGADVVLQRLVVGMSLG